MSDPTTPPPTPRSRRRGLGTEVGNYLRKHRGIEVALDDIVDALSLSRSQVHSAVHNLRSNGFVIDHPRKGWYVYRSSKQAGGPVLVKQKAEVMALLDDERLLVNVEGRLYVATPANL